MSNVLGIVWHLNTSGVIEYRCRGIGQKYNGFYQDWVKTSSYRCTDEDWPWDYFVFDNPADHKRLIDEFKDDVREEKQ